MKLPELDDVQYSTLNLALGYATGAAKRDGNDMLADSFTRLTNKLNENNPDFTPYVVPED